MPRSYYFPVFGDNIKQKDVSHGAGRTMSRTVPPPKSVECRKDADVIDEIPMAHKDIDAVMAAQADLVEIVHTLKQVVCVKG